MTRGRVVSTHIFHIWGRRGGCIRQLSQDFLQPRRDRFTRSSPDGVRVALTVRCQAEGRRSPIPDRPSHQFPRRSAAPK
jgi:hypothetical protein